VIDQDQDNEGDNKTRASVVGPRLSEHVRADQARNVLLHDRVQKDDGCDHEGENGPRVGLPSAMKDAPNEAYASS
jgi:hypothetical protein